ncbi:MAG: hypothetical protein ACKOW8_08645, partial [Flavobacteriales bacterium]
DSGAFCTISSDGFTNRYLDLSSDTVLNIVCFGSCNECGYVAPPTPTYNVTFRLDMSEQSGFTIPEVNGTFNGWCGNCNPMSDLDNDSIWELTIPLLEGMLEYKFSFDNWTGQEYLDSGAFCTISSDGFTNRYLDLSSDTVLPVVCWGACVACAVTPVYYDITFQVDMNGQTGFTTPELNGTFNGWCGSCSPMIDADGDNVWTITIPLQAATYEYKYSYDSWTGQETLITGMPCTQTSPEGFVNRVVTVDGVTDLGVVCWESCNACNVVVLNQMNLPVTFDDEQVEYGIIGFDGSENAAVEVDPTNAANRVARVTKSASAGASSGATITAPAELGFSNAIPFTADATTMSVRVWSPDAGIQVRLKVEDHSDPTHSVETNVNTTVANDWEVLVFDFSNQSNGTAALNLSYSYDKASIFFNFGVDGATAGEKTYYFDDVVFGGQGIVATQYNVTFQVDMQNVSGFAIPEVNGSFNGWCGGCFALNDNDGDGIWIGTAAIDEGVHEYKFAYDAWTGQENLLPGLPCTVTNFGFTNRSLNVTGDVVLPVVCWESCGDCLAAPVNHEVTFQVDMNGVVGFTTPEVNGTFNNWCGSCFPMTDTDGDNIWEGTTTLAVGSYEYKYSYDNWSGSEQLTEGSNCTVTNSGFTNRILNLDSDTVLNVVCWSSCTSCDSTPPPPVMHNVTFRVDMSQQVGFTTPEVNGTFNNWCGSCFPMTDTDGDNIWEATTMLAEGQYEYKFSNDNWTGQESLTAGSSCTITAGAFTNRFLDLSSDTLLPEVCWGSCSQCQLAQPVSVEFIVDVSGESFSENVVILGSFNNFCDTCDTLSSIGGDLYSVELNLLPGVYEYYFGLDNWANLEMLNDAACTVLADTVFHRLITVTEATILPEVCWNSCDTCDVISSVTYNNPYSTIIVPNPANDQLNIKLNNP